MNTFVSRGGIKLQHAIENWKSHAPPSEAKRSGARAGALKNCVVLDVGSSTGGFVDCLLQNGASKVYALDTSYGELAWKLRQNPKVKVMERVNILYLESLESVDLITIDAGWTKLELVLPVVKKFLKKGGQIIALLKPQYEAKSSELSKGVVQKEKLKQVKDQAIEKIKGLGFKIKGEIGSPIQGGGGNSEYLLLI
jgi:23S rRNA (cytidine1920-2'-O)/16S rRNA (cytidine1409-2'-O)-methyltransferase